MTQEEGETFAKEHKVDFLETSALDNSDQMIEKVFVMLTQDIIERKQKEVNVDIGKDDVRPITINKTIEHKVEKKKGCSG